MLPEIVHALQGRRPQIRERWEALLRTERPSSPLANPDSLVHLTDWALNEILGALSSEAEAPPRSTPKNQDPQCACGRNPYLGFFLGGEQAILEALVLSQAAQITRDPVARDAAVAELDAVLRQVRNREIEAFCALCQHRPAAIAAAANPGTGTTAG